MIESTSDAIQLLVLVACFTVALVRTLRMRNVTWLTMACFFACMLFGNAYWFGFLLVFGESPQFSYVADLGWCAAYVFLLMLVIENDQCRGVRTPVLAAWVPVVVCAACCAYYIIDYGSPLLNLADNGLVAAIGFFAVRGIAAGPVEESASTRLADNKAFHWAVLAFVIVEQALWLSSCFQESGPILAVSPYIVLNFCLTLSYVVILACAWRSDAS